MEIGNYAIFSMKIFDLIVKSWQFGRFIKNFSFEGALGERAPFPSEEKKQEGHSFS